MNELRRLLESLPPSDRRALLWRARYLYIRYQWARLSPQSRRRLIPLYATLASGIVLPILFILSLLGYP